MTHNSKDVVDNKHKLRWTEIVLAISTALLFVVGVIYSIYTAGIFSETHKMRLQENRPHVFVYFNDDISVELVEFDESIPMDEKLYLSDLIESARFNMIAKFYYENMSDLPAFNLTPVIVQSKSERIEPYIPDSINYNLIKPSEIDSFKFVFKYTGKGFEEIKNLHIIAYYEFDDEQYYNYSVYRLFPPDSALVRIGVTEKGLPIVEFLGRVEFGMIYQDNGKFE